MYHLSEKVEKLMAQEGVLKEILAAGSVEDMKAAFAAHGVEITDEELATILKAPNEETGDGELSEDALDTVSGGFIAHLAGLTGLVWQYSCDLHGGADKAVAYTYNWWADRITGKKKWF